MIWKPIYDGHYIVSSVGIVQRAKHPRAGRVLSQGAGRGGYMKVSLCVNGREFTRSVHSLVALAFIGDRPEGMVINHIDGIKTNNSVENLEYTTHQGNSDHAVAMGLAPSGERSGRYTKPERTARGERTNKAKASEAQVIEMRKKWDLGATLPELVKEYGLSKSATWSIVTRRNWRHVA